MLYVLGFFVDKLFICMCLPVCVHTAYPKFACYKTFLKDFNFIKSIELKLLHIMFILD